ncbi:MAG: sugar ABC transporter substrate-binding protein [Bifidobacteriaceae bacterium]|jgi:multiple sugar transport system substrate-binding protein|nr:sugar ABC transporter substrate-binding protein [Bifidobacteriaceae bacterium]
MSQKQRSARVSRRVLILTLVGAVGLTLAACEQDSSPSSKSTPPSGASGAAGDTIGVDDGTELTMWTRAPLERQANALVDAYNSSHQNQVKLEIIPNDDMEGKVGAAATNDELPDLLAGDVVRLPYWVENGMFTELTDQIEALPFRSDIARGHLDAGTLDGQEHTVPFVTDISVMVWNKDLYEAAGLDPEKGPTTLQEFVDQSKAVAASGGADVSGTYFGGNCGGCLVFTWFPYIWGAGDEVLSEDGKTALLDGDNAKAVYAAYKDLYKSGAVGEGSKEETGGTWTAPFAEGKIGVMPYPNTSVYAAAEAGINVGVGAIPGVSGGQSTFLGGDAMGISKDSKSVEQAWNFLAWMLSDETQLEVVAKNGEVPCRTSLLDNEYTQADPLALTMNATVAYGRTPVATYFAEAFNAAGSPWTVLFRNAVFEDADTLGADNQAITDVLDQ